VRNWDYRYCWLRDASLTLQALFDLGYTTEAEAFLSWLVHTTRITWPELRVLYDVYGVHRSHERVLAHLSGFADSRPVRLGNAAAEQLQLDVYGEVIDAAYQFVSRGGLVDRATAHMLVGYGQTVCRRWREPDAGIWELRFDQRHHTYSKVMCWVALDRLLRLSESGRIRVPVAQFAEARREIARQIEQRGFNTRLGSYVSVFDGADVDASLLHLGRCGYADPTSARMRGTLDVIEARLGRNGLLFRYPADSDGLPPGEGAFGLASFWAVTAKAIAGDVDGATAAFERMLSFANDVGLFAEEIDADSGAALGNFPQTITHVGLVYAALTLAAARSGQARPSSPSLGRPDRTRASTLSPKASHVDPT